MASHARSISLPSKSHSNVLKAEAELHKLRASLSSSSQTSQTILDVLQGLCNFYECINDILCMSSIQSYHSQPQQRRLIDRAMEESINLLDICNISKDNLGEIKRCIHDLELAMRRCESETLKSKTREYIQLVKKASKYLKKEAPNKNESTEEDSEVLGLLGDAREIAISLFQSVFSFLSKQIHKTGKWSLLQKRSFAIKENAFDICSLGVNVDSVENGLECLFTHMIRCRVSLLNNCTL